MSTPESNPAPPSSPNTRQRPTPLAESLPDADDILAGGSGTVIREAPSARHPATARTASGASATASSHARQLPEVAAALRQAGLLRARGDVAAADREVRQAIAKDAASSPAYEMLGDLQLQAGESRQAAESYRRAQSCGAGAAIESKIARATLQSSHAETQMLSEVPLTRGRPWLGYIASALIPGLGIALAGEYARAAVAFIGWAGSLGLIFAVPGARAVIESMLGGARAGSVAAQGSNGGQFLFLLLGLANLGFYVYSLVETGRIARGSAAPKQ